LLSTTVVLRRTVMTFRKKTSDQIFRQSERVVLVLLTLPLVCVAIFLCGR
jgi:hypothetical protein